MGSHAHDHDEHDHGHGHGHGHGHEHPPSPAHRQSAVVLDIGGSIGALVIYTAPERDEVEIDISPGTDPGAPRSHNQVHPRRMRTGTVYSAVYPQLQQGQYTIWRDQHTPAATIAIVGGEVTEYHFD